MWTRPDARNADKVQTKLRGCDDSLSRASKSVSSMRHEWKSQSRFLNSLWTSPQSEWGRFPGNVGYTSMSRLLRFRARTLMGELDDSPVLSKLITDHVRPRDPGDLRWRKQIRQRWQINQNLLDLFNPAFHRPTSFGSNSHSSTKPVSTSVPDPSAKFKLACARSSNEQGSGMRSKPCKFTF